MGGRDSGRGTYQSLCVVGGREATPHHARNRLASGGALLGVVGSVGEGRGCYSLGGWVPEVDVWVRKRKKGKGGDQSNITLLGAISGQPWAWEESTLPPTVLLWGRWAWMGVVVGWLARGGCGESYIRWYSGVIHWRKPNHQRNILFFLI